ncbi:conserved hypothetical protein [Ricinus communis]|uniref:Uncharacterized protein n=1 Tax=Ricinus communis TaxID=3988 RepID=B9T1S9_RICCO|nr:conserved hypothetical protein [Ricinus communis]
MVLVGNTEEKEIKSVKDGKFLDGLTCWKEVPSSKEAAEAFGVVAGLKLAELPNFVLRFKNSSLLNFIVNLVDG